MLTISKLEELIASCFELKREYTKLKEQSDECYAQLKRRQNEIVALMENEGMEKYASKSGNFSFRYSSSFKTPKTPEQKEKFFNYLKEKGLFEEMVTVNSRTLNSWAKQEEEYQREMFKEIEFDIPGLERGTPEIVVSMTKN